MVSAGFTSLTFALFFELLPPQEDHINIYYKIKLLLPQCEQELTIISLIQRKCNN